MQSMTFLFKVMATFADHHGLLRFSDQLLMDKGDSDGFFSSRLVYRTSDSYYNSTNSLLLTVDYQQSFMACDLLCV